MECFAEIWNIILILEMHRNRCFHSYPSYTQDKARIQTSVVKFLIVFPRLGWEKNLNTVIRLEISQLHSISKIRRQYIIKHMEICQCLIFNIHEIQIRKDYKTDNYSCLILFDFKYFNHENIVYFESIYNGS